MYDSSPNLNRSFRYIRFIAEQQPVASSEKIIVKSTAFESPRNNRFYLGVPMQSHSSNLLYPYPVYFAVWVCEISCLLPLFWLCRGLLPKNMRRWMPVFAFDSIISYFCACFRANFIIYRKFFPVNWRKIEKSNPCFLHIPPSFLNWSINLYTCNTESCQTLGQLNRMKGSKKMYQ